MKRFISALLSAVLVFACAADSFAFNSNKKIELLSLTTDTCSPVFVSENSRLKSVRAPLLKAGTSGASLPSEYDSRDYGIVPEIRSQGYTGSCWAFATMAALEIDAAKQGYKNAGNVDFSESHLVWFTYSDSKDKNDPLYGEQYVASNPYMIGGNWYRSAGTLSRWSGIAEEKDFPFTQSSDFSSMSNYDESGRYSRSSGLVVRNIECIENTDGVKQWIIDHGSITAAIWWADDYENTDTSSYYYPGATGNTNHMVDIVGWDDSYSKNNFDNYPGGDGAWIVRDSWGISVHKNGYFYLSYYDKSLSSLTGFTVQQADKYYKNYTYNGAGISAAFNSENGAPVANIYTSKGSEKLTSVSFAVLDSNVTAEISVYTGFGNSANPTIGECKSKESVSIANAGYHTVDLTTPVNLKAGEKFAVSVAFSSESGKVRIPVERLNQTYDGTTYYTSRGQSVCCLVPGTNNWDDVVNCEVGNFYIQAFTECVHDYSGLTCTGENSFGCVCSQCAKTINLENVYLNSSMENIALELGTGKAVSYSVTPELVDFVEFESSDKSVFTVDANGYVQAVAVGNAQLTLRLKGSNITCVIPVTVNCTQHAYSGLVCTGDTTFGYVCSKCSHIENLENVYINSTTEALSLKTGNETDISYSVTPELAGFVELTSSDTGVVTVDKNGHIKAVGAGEALITISLKGSTIKYEIPVTVIKAEKPVSVQIINYNVYNNKSVDYKSTVTFRAKAENADSVKWHVSGASFIINDDGSCTVVEAKNDFSVYAEAFGEDGSAKTETETVLVKHKFFDKLKAFFKGLFGKLPDLIQ